MRCPYCENTKSRVRDTYRLTDSIIRLRRCESCGKYWQTLEEIYRKVTPEEAEKKDPEQKTLFDEVNK